ncbi:hypothetical protein [Azospirillum sp.]|uniref:hypothetical protein n=1 Tax=Azospirillum sp. TaxID=34012 RepID=UPI003D7057CB
MARSLPFSDRIDDLHRRYDGPLPDTVARVAALGGRARAEALSREVAWAFHQRLAADARLGAARRRAALAAAEVSGDAWLARLCATLAHHRHTATGLRTRVGPPP